MNLRPEAARTLIAAGRDLSLSEDWAAWNAEHKGKLKGLWSKAPGGKRYEINHRGHQIRVVRQNVAAGGPRWKAYHAAPSGTTKVIAKGDDFDNVHAFADKYFHGLSLDAPGRLREDWAAWNAEHKSPGFAKWHSENPYSSREDFENDTGFSTLEHGNDEATAREAMRQGRYAWGRSGKEINFTGSSEGALRLHPGGIASLHDADNRVVARWGGATNEGLAQYQGDAHWSRIYGDPNGQGSHQLWNDAKRMGEQGTGKKLGASWKSKPSSSTLAESAQTAALSVTHAPIGKGGTNWVTRSKPGNQGQLPAYVQNVRNALMRDGKDESEATAIAVGTIKRWASGRGNVSPEVKAAAAKAIAEWEATKVAGRAGDKAAKKAA